jgi:hypothetical protein
VHGGLVYFGCKTIAAQLLIQLSALEVLLMKVNVYSKGHFEGRTVVPEGLLSNRLSSKRLPLHLFKKKFKINSNFPAVNISIDY